MCMGATWLTPLSHTDPVCNYVTESSSGHSTIVGVAADGYGIYGKFETADQRPCDLDVCHGHVGAVPATTTYGVSAGTYYHYHVSDADTYPYTWILGCYGDPTTPVTLATCESLYDGCGSGGDTANIITDLYPSGKEVKLWCPCFDVDVPEGCELTTEPTSTPTLAPTLAPTPSPSPTTYHIPITCLKLQKLFGGSLEQASCHSTALQIGVGGSSGSCTRVYTYPILFVPLSSSLDSTTTLTLSFSATDVSKASLIDVDLVGLGAPRSSPTVTEDDWFLGPTSDIPSTHTLITSDLIDGSELADGDVITAASPSLLTYLQAQYDASDKSSLSYAALRLGGNGDPVCNTACDGSCSIKRLFLDTTSIKIAANLSSQVVDGDGFTKPIHQSTRVAAACNVDGSISLSYTPDSLGNVIPDFSMVGYRNGEEPIPFIPTIATIEADPDEVDATVRARAKRAYLISELNRYSLAFISGSKRLVPLCSNKLAECLPLFTPTYMFWARGVCVCSDFFPSH